MKFPVQCRDENFPIGDGESVLRVYAEGRTQEMVKALLGYGEKVAERVV